VKVVAIINHKGGVGKTTLTANLGAGLAARGQRVLLIDLDSQASLTVSFFTQNEWTDELLPSRTIKHWFDGLGTGDAMEDPSPLVSSPPRVLGKLRRNAGHLDLIAAHRDLADVETALAAELISDPGRFAPLHSRLRTALTHKSLAEYDVVLIDCAPNFGLIAKNAVAAADMLVIPTKPDYLSTNGIDSLGLKIRDFTDEARSPARPRPSCSRWCRATRASRSRRSARSSAASRPAACRRSRRPSATASPSTGLRPSTVFR
jgi:chromosome partitioning protein